VVSFVEALTRLKINVAYSMIVDAVTG